ncbi:MAG: hypothetical protein F6K54_24295 [Okeania sp. SIO3B5]|uniref:hypothetical protein n=1 Tax=Okeania sp. SIO3B5 TaxID=2607811 RepID=UPI0014018335|nr:hypothetical protein [Okeania sp. SIO3B5]NEO55911.1 hypothetical protein [Okeania sp. SIO3B5]
MPFNIKALYKVQKVKKKGGKGAVEVEEQELNTTEPMETLLPKFMQNSSQPYFAEVYNDEEPNLIEQLTDNQLNNNGND